MKKTWKLPAYDSGLDLVEVLLKNRGIDPSEREGFLEPPFPDLNLVRRLLSLDAAVPAALVKHAVSEGLPIVIHGDYDVDGIVSTAVLWQTIYGFLGYRRCFPFIPNRFDHGYGLSRQSVDGAKKLVESQPDAAKFPRKILLIAVDCGITAIEEISYAKTQGFEVLVIDHHSLPAELPSCSVFWSDQVCAGGLAWIVSQSLTEDSKRFLGLAALSTIADLQPLTGFNRSLVRFGLEELSATGNVGLRALFNVAGIAGRRIGVFEVGWVLGPRLNAAGRLESAWDSLRLLCTRNERQALALVKKLDNLNRERQERTRSSLDLALKILEETEPRLPVRVVIHENFHEGIIGLVAGKIVNQLGVPAVVISKGAQYSKASARSVEGFNIVDFLRSLGNHFENIGGHAGAAGFTIRTEKIEDFLKAVESFQANLEVPLPSLKIEGELAFEEISYGLLEILERLSPFGIGNEEPLFLSREVLIKNVALVGNGKLHLKLNLEMNGKSYAAIFFGKGETYKDLKIGDRLDVVYNLSEDNWNGGRSISLKIQDLDKAGL